MAETYASEPAGRLFVHNSVKVTVLVPFDTVTTAPEIKPSMYACKFVGENISWEEESSTIGGCPVVILPSTTIVFT